jgi:uncharacterized NAD-dependent epimerase/dehydratase family protein
MTVSLELDREAKRAGSRRCSSDRADRDRDRRWGISVDAVVSDFLAGRAEQLVVEGAARGRAALGRGAGLALAPGLLGRHARPDPRLGAARFVLCHQAPARPRSRATRDTPSGRCPELVELHERIALPARPAKVEAIALNTRDLRREEARAGDRGGRGETGLPADDPVRFGPGSCGRAALSGPT